MSETYLDRAKKWIESSDVDIETIETTIERLNFKITSETNNSVVNHARVQDLKETIEFLEKELSGDSIQDEIAAPCPIPPDTFDTSSLVTDVVPIKRLLGDEKKAKFNQLKTLCN